MMKSGNYLKFFYATVILVVLHSLSDFIFSDIGTANGSKILWGIISNFLVVVLLGYYVINSTLRGFRLMFSVFVIYFIIGYFNLSIEAYIFNVTDRRESVNEILRGIFIALFFSPVLIYLFNGWYRHEISLKFSNRIVVSWVWRVFLGVILYLVFYLAAGMILQALYPGLTDFYEGKLPPMDVMVLTQFPRGFLFVSIAVLLLRTLNSKLINRAIFVGLVFSVIGGIAPLLPPSDLMPGHIRLVHGVEVGISNFLYGLVLGSLLGQKIEVGT